MIRLRIEPQPPTDEAVAIELAFAALAQRRTTGGKKLRYDAAAQAWDGPKGPLLHYLQVPDTSLDWAGVARLEGLEPGV